MVRERMNDRLEMERERENQKEGEKSKSKRNNYVQFIMLSV